MTELQFLLLKYYYERKSVNSHEVWDMFPKMYPQFTREQVKDEMSYLHGSLFIDSTPGQYHTLGITQIGEQKYKAEEFGMNQRKRFGETFQGKVSLPLLKDIPLQNPKKYATIKIKNITKNPFVIWIAKYSVEISIGGIIAGLLTTLIIMKYKIPH